LVEVRMLRGVLKEHGGVSFGNFSLGHEARTVIGDLTASMN